MRSQDVFKFAARLIACVHAKANTIEEELRRSPPASGHDMDELA